MNGDCKAIITNLRKAPVRSGYRPAHLIRDGYYTTGVHEYIDTNELRMNESCIGMITFISPEVYPHTLYPGLIIETYEGSKKTGYIEIVEVYNPILSIKNNEEIANSFDVNIRLIGSLLEKQYRNELVASKKINEPGYKFLKELYPKLKHLYVLDSIPDQYYETIVILVDLGDIVIMGVDYFENEVSEIVIKSIQEYMIGLTNYKRVKLGVAIELMKKDIN